MLLVILAGALAECKYLLTYTDNEHESQTDLCSRYESEAEWH